MLACDANGADRVVRGPDGEGTYLVTPKAPGAIVEREKRAAGVLVAELVSAVRRKSNLVSLGSLTPGHVHLPRLQVDARRVFARVAAPARFSTESERFERR